MRPAPPFEMKPGISQKQFYIMTAYNADTMVYFLNHYHLLCHKLCTETTTEDTGAECQLLIRRTTLQAFQPPLVHLMPDTECKKSKLAPYRRDGDITHWSS